MNDTNSGIGAASERIELKDESTNMNISFNGQVNPWAPMETNNATRSQRTLKSSCRESINERMYSEMTVGTSSMMNNTSSTVNNRNNQNSDDSFDGNDNNVYGQLGIFNTNINNNGNDGRGRSPSISTSVVQTNDMTLCRTPLSQSLTSTTNSFVYRMVINEKRVLAMR